MKQFRLDEMIPIFGKAYAFAPGDALQLNAGELHVQLRHTGTELLLSNTYDNVSEFLIPYFQTSEEIAWNSNNDLVFQIALPDRPVKIKSEHNIKILPGEKLDFFTQIPIVLQLLCGNMVFAEFSSRILKNTWLGTPEAGESGYALTGRMYRSHTAMPRNENCVSGFLTIQNSTSHLMEFKDICLDAPHMAIHYHNSSDRLITDHCVLTICPDSEKNTLTYHVPENSRPLSSARRSRRGNTLVHNFIHLLQQNRSLL